MYKRQALVYAKAVLLISNDETELLKGNILANERVRPDDNRGCAGGEAFQRFAFCLCPHRAGKQLHLHAKRLKQAAQVFVCLLYTSGWVGRERPRGKPVLFRTNCSYDNLQ